MMMASALPRESDASSIEQRYQRAARLTAPKHAGRSPTAGVDGYWLDESHFFFLAERFEPSLGRVLTIPSIVDSETERIAEVMPLDSVAMAISRSSDTAVDLKGLSSARFDMARKGVLAVSVLETDYLIDVAGQSVIEAKPSLPVAALYSPNGSYACWVKGCDLWLTERGSGEVRPLTTDGAPYRTYGQASESNLSALSYRRKPSPRGMWSPDSEWFLTHRIDERAVPSTAVIEHVPASGGRHLTHEYRCPVPGDPLPVATYVAIHVASGRRVEFDSLPAPVVSPYVPFSQTAWFSESNSAWALRFDQRFKCAELIHLDLARGVGRIVLREEADCGYIDLQTLLHGPPNVQVLNSSEEVVWFSQVDGWGHLYLHDGATGALKNRITEGPWRVRDLVYVDEAHRKVLFLAGGLDPKVDRARRVLCSVNLDGSGLEVLLSHDGDVFVPPTLSNNCDQTRPHRFANAREGVCLSGRRCIVHSTNVERGNDSLVFDLKTLSRTEITSVRAANNANRPIQFSALGADSATELHGVMFLPSDFDPTRRYPLIDYIYPGPHSMFRPQSFDSMGSALARTLAELGFITLMLDTRGMPIGSRAFHQAGYGAFLELEPQLADHAAVVRQLCAKHSFIESGRIGMIGASAGGSATAMALLNYGDLFKVGVAVCGLYDATRYLSSVSDKYQGRHGLEKSEPVHFALAHKLNGRLLLVSGDLDQNVPVTQTLLFVDALVRANRDFDLLVIPNEGHDVLQSSGYVQRRVWDYFVRNLLELEPPRQFSLEFDEHELSRAARVWWREAVRCQQ